LTHGNFQKNVHSRAENGCRPAARNGLFDRGGGARFRKIFNRTKQLSVVVVGSVLDTEAVVVHRGYWK